MATPKDNNNRTKQQNADQKLIDGVTKHAATIPTVVIGGSSYTTAAIIAVLQQRLTASKASQATRATWQNAVKADKDERASTKAFVSGLRQALQVAFAGSIDSLADFGLTPRKPRVITPEQKTAAAAKAKATRAARHTMGPKAKLAVKGDVTGVVVTPVTSQAAASPAPAAPAPAAAPAAPAPTATGPAAPSAPPAAH